MNCLNSLHTKINYTFERAKIEIFNGKYVQTLNFSDVKVILNEDNIISTDIYYKPTNAHEYLNYNSDHPEHTKKNIPYNLAKRILCFVSDPVQENYRLQQLRSFLQNREYPETVINRSFFNAKLQGPAHKPTNNKNVLPFVTTNYSNYNFHNIIREAKNMINNINQDNIKNAFENTEIILSQRQPNNLLSILTKAKFSEKKSETPTISKCNDVRCRICSHYIQFTTEFNLANGKKWITRKSMSCNAKNVIYYLTCNQCEGKTTYIGKTNNLRLRTNQHISTCRTGRGSDKFDLHVFNCNNTPPQEPYFKLFLMMHLATDDALLTYEKHFHNRYYDTLNVPT